MRVTQLVCMAYRHIEKPGVGTLHKMLSEPNSSDSSLISRYAEKSWGFQRKDTINTCTCALAPSIVVHAIEAEGGGNVSDDCENGIPS